MIHWAGDCITECRHATILFGSHFAKYRHKDCMALTEGSSALSNCFLVYNSSYVAVADFWCVVAGLYITYLHAFMPVGCTLCVRLMSITE